MVTKAAGLASASRYLSVYRRVSSSSPHVATHTCWLLARANAYQSPVARHGEGTMWFHERHDVETALCDGQTLLPLIPFHILSTPQLCWTERRMSHGLAKSEAAASCCPA